jgi:NAD+ diphosphatase
MAFPLFDRPADEPSRFVGFSGGRIDRLSENRSEDSLPAALADPDARYLIQASGRMWLKQTGDAFDAWFTRVEIDALPVALDQAIFLGLQDGTPVIALPGKAEPDALPEPLKAIDNRSVYVQGLADEPTLGAVALGASLLSWNAATRFCGRCGAPTEMRIGGYKRKCTSCGAESFPRTDPVAIMLTVTRERCLLGRSPHFPPGMYSALAGFIEPGETIEDAVRRETFEESGIRIGRVAYHASQPWPFPHSLMIGCFGEALDETIDADLTELEDCRWFTREETRAIVAGTHPGGVRMPPPGAIAAHLIKAWAASD